MEDHSSLYALLYKAWESRFYGGLGSVSTLNKTILFQIKKNQIEIIKNFHDLLWYCDVSKIKFRV
jgi:hypothetical protein